MISSVVHHDDQAARAPGTATDQQRLSDDLQRMPNVEAPMAEHLLRLGISRQDDLIGRDPDELYEELCRLDGVRHELYLLDVFTAVIAYAEGGPPTPWWDFTPARINRVAPASGQG